MLAYVDADRFGHQDQGDRVLLQIATLLTDSLREHVDVCYRIGGDEFTILLPARDAEGAGRIDERLRAISSAGARHLENDQLSVSSALAVLEEGETAVALKMCAGTLMHREEQRECASRGRLMERLISEVIQ